MKRSNFFKMLSCIALMAGITPLAWGASHSHGVAQASANSAAKAASHSAALASTRGQSAEVKNGTKISAELMSNIDARTAKPGEKVTARVTKNVKQHGKIVVHKGDKLIGHVTSVKTAANGKSGSALGVRFDKLVAGHTTTQLNAVLTSVLSVPAFGNGGATAMRPPSMPAPAAPPAGGGGGGLLGGVGSTVGSAVGAAGSTVGGVGGTVGAATQSTLGANSGLGLSTPARQIHLQTYASADQSTSTDSVLTTKKGNLRLASGTRMRFRVEGGANAQTGK